MHAEQRNAGGGSGWRSIRFDVLEHIDALPSLSIVIHEFLALSRQEFFTAADFEAVIAKDQALVARVLKVANSGLYARSRTVPSIAEAVVLIGLDNLKRIVYSVSTEGLTRQDMTHYRFHPGGGFWMHSMAVGLTARVLAEAAKRPGLRSEEAFVAGLLHDVAKLVIDDFLPEGVSDADRAEEREAVGLDHAELAEYMLKQWHLPDAITEAVRGHHTEPGSSASMDDDRGGVLLGLAEALCDHWQVGRGGDLDLGLDTPVEPHVARLAVVGLDPEGWENLVWDIRQVLVNIEELYHTDT